MLRRVLSFLLLTVGLAAFMSRHQAAPSSHLDLHFGFNDFPAGLPNDGGVNDCIASTSPVVGDLFSFQDKLDTRFNDSGADRCFRLYKPPRKPEFPEKLPVVVYFHEMYDRAVHACQEESYIDLRRQAEEKGFALVCADANVHWDIPENKMGKGVCQASSSADFSYVQHILKSIGHHNKTLNPKQVFFMGHSEGAAFTNWASFCFSHEIRGFASSGFGLKLHGPAVLQRHCDKVRLEDYNCQPGVDDGVDVGGYGACNGCEVSPIDPWRTKNVAHQDLRICLLVAENDYFRPTMWSMEAALRHKHIPFRRLLIEGKHEMPQGFGEMMTSCLQVTDYKGPKSAARALEHVASEGVQVSSHRANGTTVNKTTKLRELVQRRADQQIL
mmetsp:Transcript_50197/g.109038  ORF Transcript_50197/g.109038 Transcript_50197/m.109038 type:complete len:385 (+) Transcript_50197:58-1212(+)